MIFQWNYNQSMEHIINNIKESNNSKCKWYITSSTHIKEFKDIKKIKSNDTDERLVIFGRQL